MTAAGASTERRAVVALRWGGWCLVLMCVFVRALLGTETMPYWDVDPTRLPSIPTGLTPAWSQVVDVLIIGGSGAALLGEAVGGAGISLACCALALVGAVGVALHGLVIRGGSLDDLVVGTTWVAAIAAGLGAMHVCRDERVRRVTLVLAFSLVVLLSAKGMLQVWYEHRITMDQYRENPEQFLAGQGWLKDSAQARAFERRLSQPEATGWFGLANVFATFAAGGLVALVGWTLLAWRRARDRERLMPDGWAGLLTIGMFCAAVGLALAGSKGGATVGAIGLALLAGGMLLRRQRLGPLSRILTERAGGLLALALVLSAVLALMVRGAVGERVGELSLLFRWFYIVGAMRIFASHALFGVGPAGFKDAYMLAKPPISPEEVQSPHSVMFDFGATLGVFGLLWVALWLVWVFALGRTIVRGVVERESPPAAMPVDNPNVFAPARVDLWLVLILTAVPVMVSSWAERTITTPESAAARMAGLAGWIGVSLGGMALARLDRGWRWAAAVGALVMALHGQIDVTPVWAGSTCLFMVMVAGAGAGLAGGRSRRPTLAAVPGLILVAFAGAWVVLGAMPVWRWERELAAAAREVRPLSEIAMRYEEFATSGGHPANGDTPERIAADAAAIAGLPTPRSAEEFERLMNGLTVRLTGGARPHLEAACGLAPHDVPTAEAYCRCRMVEASAEAALGDAGAARAIGEEVSAWANAFVSRLPKPTASAWGVLGTVWSTRAELEHDTRDLEPAIEAWQKAAGLDPYGLTFPVRIFRAYTTLNRPEALKIWGRKLLELNTLQRLDPLRGLTGPELEQAQKAANGP